MEVTINRGLEQINLKIGLTQKELDLLKEGKTIFLTGNTRNGKFILAIVLKV
jgi:hypothetical protein